MGWRWIRRVCLLGALLPALAVPVAAYAQIDSREGIALQNQLYQLRQEIEMLRSDAARGRGGGGNGGSGEIAAQLLSRVQAMEEQVRELRGRIDETQNLAARQNADLSKRLDDLTFQLNLQGRSGSVQTPIAPSAVPAQPPIREAAPRIEPPPRIEMTLPAVIPPPPPPPRSFTLNQTPDAMREERQPTAPAAARIDPLRPVPRPYDPAPKPPASQPAAARIPPAEVTEPAVPPGGKRTPELALQEGTAALARRDYASAERAAREVMANRASPRAYDGQFLLAQALSGQKQFAQAAIAFDDAYNRAHKGRHAQDALLGLAGALTAINEKRAACDTLNRLRTEFPQVRADIHESITKTYERAGCGR